MVEEGIMSAPVREPDGSSQDGPAEDASAKPGPSEPEPNPADPPPKGGVATQSAASESAEPPWKRSSRQRGVFAGDVAIVELRNKLALAPDRLPDPPPPSTSPGYGLARRLAIVAVVIAVGVIGYQLGSAPPAVR